MQKLPHSYHRFEIKFQCPHYVFVEVEGSLRCRHMTLYYVDMLDINQVILYMKNKWYQG